MARKPIGRTVSRHTSSPGWKAKPQDRPALSTARTVLVADDDEIIRSLLREQLRASGYRVVETVTGAETLERVLDDVNLVLLDYKLPDMDGISVLRRIRQSRPDTIVIIMTAYSSVESAVDAMKIGAYHYLNKPFSLEAVQLLVEQALETQRLRAEVRVLRTDRPPMAQLHRLVGASRAMSGVRKLLKRLATAPSPGVLLEGEAGTGKDLCARVLHEESTRRSEPFLAINCAAAPTERMDAELFGREKGDAMTPGVFELASGGTVYVDGVAALPADAQACLLRLLEERAFHRIGGRIQVPLRARIVASVQHPLARDVADGSFRADLAQSHGSVTVILPPQRDRTEDVAPLARHFLVLLGPETGTGIGNVAPDAIRLLKSYRWPGNVRELRNAVERALILAKGPSLHADDFGALGARGHSDGPFRLPDGGVRLEEVERGLVSQALERAQGNQTKAAALLGLNRFQIRSRMQKHGISVRGSRRRA